MKLSINPIKALSLAWICIVMLASCVTTTGNFVVTATDAKGNPLNTNFFVEGRHIYSARNGICTGHPGATVTIRAQATGKELEGESPYRCR